MRSDISGWVQVIIELFAFGFAFYIYKWGEYRQDKDRQQERLSSAKKNILASVKQELELNWQLLHNPPLLPPDKYHPEYYDPTRQVFKYRDDAITLALTSIDVIGELGPKLTQRLLQVSTSVRFVNQQIDELMAFRFGSPEVLANTTDYIRDHVDSLIKFHARPDKIPKRFRNYLQALALRHWAIVNEGYWKRLNPSLEAVRDGINKALREAGLPEANMPDRATLDKSLNVWRAKSITGVGIPERGAPLPPSFTVVTSKSITGDPGLPFGSSGSSESSPCGPDEIWAEAPNDLNAGSASRDLGPESAPRLRKDIDAKEPD